jgi:hypothetical protein
VLLHEALEFAGVDVNVRLPQGFQHPVVSEFWMLFVDTLDFSADVVINQLVSA